MIITLIFIALTVIGLFLFVKFDCDYDHEYLFGIGVGSFTIGAIALVICFFIVLFEHVGVSAKIEENNIKYESLCERQELISSQYEDVSRSDIIKDIAEWNADVYSYKHWANNPWTSWFYSQKVADHLQIIEGGDT